MSNNVRVVLHDAGIRAFLQSPLLRADLERRAKAIAEAAGPGFKYEIQDDGDRIRAAVWADTFPAKLAEAENRALTRAIEAGRR